MAVKKWFDDQRVYSELERMSDRELQDIGINRGDFRRLTDVRLNQDLLARGRH